MDLNLHTHVTWQVDNLLLYLYVDKDAFDVLILEKPLKRFHKVLLKGEGVFVNRVFNVPLHAGPRSASQMEGEHSPVR